MKKTIFFWMLGVVATLVSCNQSDDMLGNNPTEEKTVTFSLQTQQPVTRAGGEGLRYVVAIYSEDGTTEVKSEETFHADNFSIMLPPGNYTSLFWADYGDANYDATDLTSVTDRKNTTADANAEAFFAKQSITVSDGSAINVELKRAIAQIILKENDVLDAGTIEVTYDRPMKFNVKDGTISETAPGESKSITFNERLDGTVTPVEIGNFYVLAPATEAQLGNFKVQYENETEKVLSNVPIQANYKTNITGKYGANINQQFIIAVDQQWEASDKEGTLFTIGADYQYKNGDKTYDCIVVSSTLTSGVVACKTKQAKAADKAAAMSTAASIGARLTTYDEFLQLTKFGFVNGYDFANYYCFDYERCWYLVNSGGAGHDDGLESNLPYYIAFDIPE